MTLSPDAKSGILYVGGCVLIGVLVGNGHVADIQSAMIGYATLCGIVLGHDVASGRWDVSAQTTPAPAQAATP